MRLTTLLAALILSVVTLALASAAFADTAMAPLMVMSQKNDPAHASVFNAKASKDASLRAEIATEVSDTAFTMWMMRDHPYLYAASCVKIAHGIYQHCKQTQAMTEFGSIAIKRADIKAAVHAEGYDVAFVDWLWATHPDLYKQHLSYVGKIPAINSGK